MTYDDMINGGYWNGEHLALRKRMAEYLVDGRRLGEIEWEKRSGSPHDPELAQTDSEILTAALTLAHLKHEQVEIHAHDADGKPLEKPDLDATIGGRTIGIEVAEVPAAAKHETLKNRIEVAVTTRLHDDPVFRSAFGDHFLSVNLNPIAGFQRVPIEGNHEADALLADIDAFVRAGLSVPNDGRHLRPFPAQFAALTRRGCEYHISEMASGPYFDLGDGPGPASSADRTDDVLKVLDKHRGSAAKNYRALPETWMVLFLPDADELFRRTVEAAERRHPAIIPFDRCFLTDTIGIETGAVVELVPAVSQSGGTAA